MKFIKLLIISSLLGVLMVLFIACGEKNTSTVLPEPRIVVDPDKPGWEQDSNSVTFDWYINFPWYTGKWGQDEVTKHITELTGVNINFVIPAGNPNEKLNTLIVSDSLPDLITIGWYEDIAKQIQTPKFLYDLEELAETYDPYFFKVTNETSRNWYRREDGGVYGYPNISYVPSDYEDPANNFSNDSFMVRKDIYEAIGSPDMSTPEGFIAALEQAQKQFPEINGQPIIPIGFASFDNGIGTLGEYIQNFLAIPQEKNDKLYDRDTDPDYVEWLKTMRTANENGLISRDIFSDTRRQIEEKITQGRYFALLYPYIDAIWPLTNRFTEDPDSTYISVAGPKNSKGSEHQLIGGGISGWTLTMISKNNKDPEKAIRFLEFLFSEKGKEVAFLGKKGETWDMIDGKAQFFPDIEDMRQNQRSEFDKKYGADWLLWMGMDLAYQNKHWPIPVPPSYRQQKEWSIGKAVPRFQFENLDPVGNTELGVKRGKYIQKRNELIPKLILAGSESEFDTLLEDYVVYRDENGFSDVEQYMNDRYKENKVKLGL